MWVTKWKDEKIVRFEGNATSEPIDISDCDPVWLYLPGFAGESVTFQTKVNDTWVDVESGGTPVSHTVTTPGASERAPSTLSGLKVIRLVSTATETLEGRLLCST